MFSLIYRVAAPCPNPILEFKETLDHGMATLLSFRIGSAFDRNVRIRYPTPQGPDRCSERHRRTQEVYHTTLDSFKTQVLGFIAPRSSDIESMGHVKVNVINDPGLHVVVESHELQENGMIHMERGTAERSWGFVVDSEIMSGSLSGY